MQVAHRVEDLLQFGVEVAFRSHRRVRLAVQSGQHDPQALNRIDAVHGDLQWKMDVVLLQHQQRLLDDEPALGQGEFRAGLAHKLDQRHVLGGHRSCPHNEPSARKAVFIKFVRRHRRAMESGRGRAGADAQRRREDDVALRRMPAVICATSTSMLRWPSSRGSEHFPDVAGDGSVALVEPGCGPSTSPGVRTFVSIGVAITDPLRTAILACLDWQPALDGDGGLRDGGGDRRDQPPGRPVRLPRRHADDRASGTAPSRRPAEPVRHHRRPAPPGVHHRHPRPACSVQLLELRHRAHARVEDPHPLRQGHRPGPLPGTFVVNLLSSDAGYRGVGVLA
jgi:hypothetical protein